MAITELSVSALPGKPHSFLPKVAGPHTGLFTELSVSALPGKRHSFLAKEGVSGPHIGLFTELSVLALPGPRHSFLAKTGRVIHVPPKPSGGGYEDRVYGRKHRLRLKREDQELLEIVVAIVESGILE